MNNINLLQLEQFKQDETVMKIVECIFFIFDSVSSETISQYYKKLRSVTSLLSVLLSKSHNIIEYLIEAKPHLVQKLLTNAIEMFDSATTSI